MVEVKSKYHADGDLIDDLGEETPPLEQGLPDTIDLDEVTPTDLLHSLMIENPDLPVIGVRFKGQLYETKEEFEILEPNQDSRFPGGAIVLEVKEC